MTMQLKREIFLHLRVFLQPWALCKGAGKTIEGCFQFLLADLYYYKTNSGKKELQQIEVWREQDCTKLRITQIW